MVEKLAWGEGPEGKPHSALYICVNPDCTGAPLRNHKDRMTKPVIGIRKNPDGESESYRDYIATCECPTCFEKYWFHTTEFFAEEATKLKRG